MTSFFMTVLAGAAGLFTYFLPQSDLSFEVSVRKETFHAGPYAKYASKYLGIDARQHDETTFEISEVKLTSFTEAETSVSYSAALSPEDAQRLLALTSQGLVCTADARMTANANWRFPISDDASFATKGIPANLETETGTLYGREGTLTAGGIVQKSLEKKAGEVAEMIFKIRENRYKILVGDTDATYSGEAMKATVDELTRLERDYLMLFVGYSDFQTQISTFDIVPDPTAARQLYVVFRLSEEEGLVSPENISGKPYFIELSPEKLSIPSPDPKAKGIVYRIPAICKLRLTEGTKNILQTRIPIYQLGSTALYPVK